MERPNRPPDISTLIQLPTADAIEHLHKVSRDHADPDVRLLAAIVARLCPSVEGIAKAVANIGQGKAPYTSLDPNRHGESAER